MHLFRLCIYFDVIHNKDQRVTFIDQLISNLLRKERKEVKGLHIWSDDPPNQFKACVYYFSFFHQMIVLK